MLQVKIEQAILCFLGSLTVNTSWPSVSGFKILLKKQNLSDKT